VIFQVKNRQELDFSLDIGAEIIGACNRDEFNGGKTDISISLELISLIPNHVVKIAESGIESVDQAKILYQAGYDALLIGGLLMRASDPQLLLQQMRI
jgi:indole-3-glycerol phosphate synthase